MADCEKAIPAYNTAGITRAVFILFIWRFFYNVYLGFCSSDGFSWMLNAGMGKIYRLLPGVSV